MTSLAPRTPLAVGVEPKPATTNSIEIGGSMPRYEGSQLGYRVSARTLLQHPERFLHVPKRDLSDKARLRQLSRFCESLEKWAQRFTPSAAVLAHSAALISDEGIETFLDHVNRQLNTLAPIRAASSRIEETAEKKPRSLGGKSGLDRVEELLNVLMHLSEYVVGTFGWEPNVVNTVGGTTETAAWHRSWQAPDDAVVTFVAEQIIELREIERLDVPPAKIRIMHSRLSSLARQVVRDFIKRLNRTDEHVGLKNIKRLLGANGDPDAAKAFRDFAAAVGRIAAVASERSGSPLYSTQWQGAVVRLLETHGEYSSKCLPLLRLAGLTRVGLQKKREQLAGWVALVAQYLFLVRGNGQRARFAALCEGVRLATHEIRTQLLELPKHAFSPDMQKDIDNTVASFDQLVIDPSLSDLWHSRLGGKAKKISSLVCTITEAQGGTSKTWTLGDHVSSLRASGVLTRQMTDPSRGRNPKRGPTEQLQQLLYAMQEVGLAVQVPWGYISGEEGSLRRNSKEGLLSRRGLGWCVSPLGASLGLPPRTSQRPQQKKRTPRKRSGGKRANALPKRTGCA